jgi:hypothetical protein
LATGAASISTLSSNMLLPPCAPAVTTTRRPAAFSTWPSPCSTRSASRNELRLMPSICESRVSGGSASPGPSFSASMKRQISCAAWLITLSRRIGEGL